MDPPDRHAEARRLAVRRRMFAALAPARVVELLRELGHGELHTAATSPPAAVLAAERGWPLDALLERLSAREIQQMAAALELPTRERDLEGLLDADAAALRDPAAPGVRRSVPAIAWDGATADPAAPRWQRARWPDTLGERAWARLRWGVEPRPGFPWAIAAVFDRVALWPAARPHAPALVCGPWAPGEVVAYWCAAAARDAGASDGSDPRALWAWVVRGAQPGGPSEPDAAASPLSSSRPAAHRRAARP